MWKRLIKCTDIVCLKVHITQSPSYSNGDKFFAVILTGLVCDAITRLSAAGF